MLEEKTIGYKPFSGMDNKRRKTIISGLLFCVLTVMYTIAYNDDFRAQSLLWYGISLVTIGLLAVIVAYNYKDKSLGTYAVWAFLFFTLSFASVSWSMSVDQVLDTSKTLFLIFTVNILLSFVLETKRDVQKVLFANLVALGLYLIYILLNIDLSQLGEDRLGVEMLGSLWNANDVGMKLGLGFGICLYFAYARKPLWQKIAFIAIGIAFGGVGLFTGSRKVFLMLIGIAALMIFLRSKRKLLAALVAVAGAVLLYYLVMNVEPLYNVLGERLENMLQGLFGEEGTTEGSFNTREEMLQLGLEWFLERPILGYGTSNYAVLYEEVSGLSTYSHNNFIEMLINGGIVGFGLYYFSYAYLFIKLFKSAFFKREPLAVFLFSVNLILFILQMAMVSYTSTLFNCLLMLGVLYAKIREKDKE